MTAKAPSPRYILGVNAGFHDPSAALLRDGELVAMVEQERLSRRQHAFAESPADAIAACLTHEGIDLGDVAEVAIGWDLPALMEVEDAGRFEEEDFAGWLLGQATPPAGARLPLRFFDHHLSHAASAFHTSGFERAAILVLDGRGERVATTMAVGGPGGIEVLRAWGIGESLGFLYATAAEWAGLRARDAGKLMGLAAYGAPGQPVPLAASEGGYVIDGAPAANGSGARQLSELRERLRESFQARNYPYGPGDPREIMAHADFAASIQGALESVILELARSAREESGCAQLAMAGGVALNCTANGALARAGIFEEVWVPPFPHDAGVSLGAALLAEREARRSPMPVRRLPHAFWGAATAEPSAEAIELLSASPCEVERCDEDRLADLVAAELEQGRLVGWCQGRAEVGPRALGARSILCDPGRREQLVRANLVKGRETWRPLAPAVAADRAGDVFDGVLPPPAEFMLAAWPVRESARPGMPAAVHVDGSARPQVVRPEQRRYHDTIEAFRERTGVPAVINTSFNRAGEPIVDSADDAVRVFLESGLDVLVLDDLIARKPTAGTANQGRGGGEEAPAEREMRLSSPWSRSR